MVLYYIRKYLFIVVLAFFVILIGVLGVQKVPSDTLFVLALLALLSTWVAIMIRPSNHIYAPNGEKWIKKFEFVNTTEDTKSHKDGSFEVYYTHHFKVLCKTHDEKYKYEYELRKNGGVSGKDRSGRSYSKKISEKLFLKNRDVLEDEKN